MAQFMNIRKRKYYSPRNDCPDDEYHKLYRFSRANVEWLAEHFLENSEETRGGALNARQKMQIFLRFVSDPGFQIGVGKDEGVHRTTVSKTVKIVLTKIMEKSHLWIRFTTNNEAHQQWSSKYQFPCAIGVIDCTHIRITKPSQHGDEYCNRKGYCSLNVQATCNANEEFTSIDAQWPGSVHDSRILKRSMVCAQMNNMRQNFLLLGDSGYGITPWLMTPYRNPQTHEEITFNTLFTRERVIIERCFGQLKRRFPILQYMVRIKLDRVASVIVSCAVLHNISKYLHDNMHDDDEQENIADEQELVDEENDLDLDENLRRRGLQRREEIKNLINQLQL
ncbi:hypothetical protein NQ315_002681 [Exocentrus adspersus]|nr:hypothetical protein NQ315_002681 [Exocentrus adspersus]